MKALRMYRRSARGQSAKIRPPPASRLARPPPAPCVARHPDLVPISKPLRLTWVGLPGRSVGPAEQPDRRWAKVCRESMGLPDISEYGNYECLWHTRLSEKKFKLSSDNFQLPGALT